ncbi:ABC-three component system protein [Nocardia brasiliensis]|uniref:ABC-three component system protein n=1 Tax=Nocardia brasiliensis TaxID=37326 RepID=UPI00245725B3|nr:ABC-three component system protein [Nocardia brasiliensis]
MSYPYEDLDDSQFERLVVQCSRRLFGIGVQSFAAGPDGGRDARFHGTAERFPSASKPWCGITVIQAKHTNALNAHYSDSKFSGDSKTSVLTEEIARVKKLADAGAIDNYLLFANRRLGATASEAIIERIADDTGIGKEFISLAGIEYLNDLLREFPVVVDLAQISPMDSPLLPSSDEIAEVILAIKDALEADNPEDDAEVTDRISYESKNAANNMSPAFANVLSRRYLSYTKKIEDFLAYPGNAKILRYYEGAVEEFELKIVAKRESYQKFDDLFNHLVDILIQRDSVLASNRPLLRAMVFYMYWHCDIGSPADADSK